MTEELQRSVKAIHDLERAIRLWELLREDAQKVIDETKALSLEYGGSAEINLAVAKARACIDSCNASILVTKARIDELARAD